ncbi:MAG: hypothetical protein QGG67_07420 [Gammaproteobacteria bacterium]|jgi:hypothetical protein|nr:hypothetical protein [Gammaproteobacteria bacterium]|tara:strand:- start:2387 stop:2590 length:204 start_codon:yes stop_codon:yes gene_type:complete
MSFKKIFVITQVVCYLPMLIAVFYLQSTGVVEESGLWATAITTLAFSLLPAVFIAGCWWHYVTPEDE